MKRNNYCQKIFRIVLSVIYGLTALLSVSGCRTGKMILDYPKVWSCDYEEFKLEFTVTGFNRDCLIPATLYLDGEAIDILVFFLNPGSVCFYLIEDRDKISVYSAALMRCHYRWSRFARTRLTIEIYEDNTNREGKESLVGRKYVFHGRDITPPEAIGCQGDTA